LGTVSIAARAGAVIEKKSEFDGPDCVHVESSDTSSFFELHWTQVAD
jgi:hypothetical protein